MTTVSRLSARGSEIINTSATPFRTYTESTFSGCPGSHGMWVSFISCLFVSLIHTTGHSRSYDYWYTSRTFSIAATNSAPAFGMHHSFTSHGLSSFFYYIAYGAVRNIIHNFQTDQFIFNCLHCPRWTAFRRIWADDCTDLCLNTPVTLQYMFCCCLRPRANSMPSITNLFATPAIVPLLTHRHL